MMPVAKLELKKMKSRNSQCKPDQTSKEKENQQIYSMANNDPDFDLKDLSNFMRRSQFLAMESNTVSKKTKNNKGVMRFVGKKKEMILALLYIFLSF